jgi:hypothetical protein
MHVLFLQFGKTKSPLFLFLSGTRASSRRSSSAAEIPSKRAIFGGSRRNFLSCRPILLVFA